MAKKTWTIIADGATVKRLTGTKDKHGNWIIPPEVPKLSARVIPNAACFIYPSELEEYDAEQLRPDKETGRYRWVKVARRRWKVSGAAKNFLSDDINPTTVVERDWREGLWSEAFKKAGDKLVAFLLENPEPA